MPTKTFAAAPSPSAPPVPMVRRNSQAKPRTTGGSTRQWKSRAETALITRISGSA